MAEKTSNTHEISYSCTLGCDDCNISDSILKCEYGNNFDLVINDLKRVVKENNVEYAFVRITSSDGIKLLSNKGDIFDFWEGQKFRDNLNKKGTKFVYIYLD